MPLLSDGCPEQKLIGDFLRFVLATEARGVLSLASHPVQTFVPFFVGSGIPPVRRRPLPAFRKHSKNSTSSPLRRLYVSSASLRLRGGRSPDYNSRTDRAIRPNPP